MGVKTVVIGGGAAGLMASAVAAKNGNSVTLLEKNNRPGRKLLITGKGRCNVTNGCDARELTGNIPTNGKFLYSAFSAFSNKDTVSFFESLGVPLKTERGQRVFPVSDKASDIVDALIRNAKSCGVITENKTAEEILVSNGKVYGVRLTDKSIISADKVILATGGLSYPGTGSTGDGYKMAKAVGHTVTPLRPSLVPVCIKENFCGKMMGLSLKNVRLDVFEEGKKKPVYSEQGEMLFTHFGISGPIVLSASAHMRDIGKKNYYCILDMKPALDIKTLDNRLIRDFSESLNRDFSNSLGKLLPSGMIPTVIKLSGIAPDTKVNQITKEMRIKLAETLKNIRMTVTGFRPIEEAIITSGGISVKEINSATMESKIINGLYFAGEIIDADAYTGGFNLQIAFSTGYLAGMNI